MLRRPRFRFPYAHWIEVIAGGAVACFLIDKLARCPHRGHGHSVPDTEQKPTKDQPDSDKQDGQNKE